MAEVSITTGVGIDREVDRINSYLSQIEWLDRCYGRIWTIHQPISRNIQKLPITVDSADPLLFLRDDTKRAFSGLYLGSEKIIDYLANEPERWIRERKCAVIIGLKLDSIDVGQGDIRMYQEILRAEVEQALSKAITFQLEEFIDDNTEAIFKGFDIRDMSAQITAYPYYWMRFNGLITYAYDDCEPY